MEKAPASSRTAKAFVQERAFAKSGDMLETTVTAQLSAKPETEPVTTTGLPSEVSQTRPENVGADSCGVVS